MILSELLEQLKSEDPEEIKNAVLQLSAMEDPAAIPHLEPLKKNKDAGVRYFSKKAIDKLKKYPPTDTTSDFSEPELEVTENDSKKSDREISDKELNNDNTLFFPSMPESSENDLFNPEDIYGESSDGEEQVYDNEKSASDSFYLQAPPSLINVSAADLNSENIDDYLIKLDSQSAQDRLEAIFFLKRIPDKDIALTLTETFDNENDSMVKAVLVKILPDIVQLIPENVTICLEKGLRDEDNRVRANSVEALEKIFQTGETPLDDQQVIQMILPLIKDNDNRTKANALKLFFDFDEELVLNELEAMLKSDKIWMKDSALFALGEIKSSRVAPILILATNDSEEEIRLKAFTKLAELNKPCYLEPVLDRLFSAMAEPDHELHYIANMIISQIEKSAVDSKEYYFENSSFIDYAVDLALKHSIYNSVEALFLAQVCHCSQPDPVKLKLLFKELFQNNETNRLLKIMECLEKKGDVSNELIVQIAETCFAMGHFSRALNYYQKICRTSNEEAHTYRLGELFLINEMPGKAVEVLSKIDNSSFNPIHVKRLLAEAMIHKGLYENAFQHTNEMIKKTDTLEKSFRLELIYDIALKFEQAQQNSYAASLYSIILKEDKTFSDVADRFEWITSSTKSLTDHISLNQTDKAIDDIFSDSGDDSEADTQIIKVDKSSAGNNILSISEKIDPRYQNLKLIGTGGMGKIFRAHDSKLDRLVALKVFSQHMDSKSDKGMLFLKEAQTSAKINHYNIVQIYDFALDNETAYIVMEYVDGVTIRDLLKKRKIPPVIMKRLSTQICEAFIHAHDCGIIHRDIKPENIMVNKSGRVKVMDFGIATSDFSEEDSIPSIMGTCYYMSPEQLLGKRLDIRSDIYSMGITFYEMLSGKPPFYKGNLKYQHLHVQPAPLSSKEKNIPDTLDALIQKCLNKDPDKRYNSCRELLKELQNAQI